MLKSILVTNFQSHEESYVEFHPGVNVIVAPSRYGKSALLRSMFWCFQNKPNGDKFRSRWGGRTVCTANFEDGVLSRVRDGSENAYVLTTEDDTQTYTGFGQAVPEPVARFLNMDQVNFQRQLDRPFMLDWGPRERGVYLNEITNLEVIDRSIANIKKTITTHGKRGSFLSHSINDLEEEIRKYDFLDPLKKKIDELESLNQRLTRLETDADDLTELINKIEKAEERKASFGDMDGAMRSIQTLEKLEKEANDLEKEAGDIDSVLNDIGDTERIIKTKKKQLEELERDFRASFPDVCPLCGR